jgi:hypothetical protein
MFLHALALLGAAALAPAAAAPAAAAVAAAAPAAANAWQHRGGPPQITGFWKGGNEIDGDASIAAASSQGLTYLSLVDGAPLAAVGLARGHNCSGDAGVPYFASATEYSAFNLYVDGATAEAVLQCEIEYVPNSESWNWLGNPKPTAPGECPAPDAGAAIRQIRVPDSALPDLTGVPCGAGGAAAPAELGDTAAPPDPLTAYPLFPAAGGSASVSGVYFGPVGAPTEWVGLISPAGFIFTTANAADSFYLTTGEYTSHACVPGKPYDYVATLVKRYIYLNGTVVVVHACEAGRFDADLRVMQGAVVMGGGTCPEADFTEADFSQVRVAELKDLPPAECGSAAAPTAAPAAAPTTAAPTAAAPTAAAPRVLLGAAAAAAALAWA